MEIGRVKLTVVLFLISILLGFQNLSSAWEDKSYEEVQVGVILDKESWVGKIIYSCITMAISEFYAANPRYKTRVVLQTRDTNGEPLRALSAAADLMENSKVRAILGPESTVEANFLEALGEKATVPILSFSTSPASIEHPYFVRITQDETTQFEGIALMAESFKWKSVILICENTANGREMATYMVTAFQERSVHIAYTSLISISSNNQKVLEELHKIVTMQTTVFVMHTSASLASLVFSNAKKLGMMGEGYVWVITTKTANFLDFMDAEVIESMQGTVGFKSYVPASRKLRNFTLKWRKEYYTTNPVLEFKEPNAYGLWAYDALCALAISVERAQAEEQVTELASIGTSQRGASLLKQILRMKFHGLAGEFNLMNGRIISKALEIVNVIGKGDRRVGFWRVTDGFSQEIGKNISSSNYGLETVIWPGGTTTVPKGKMLQMRGSKLRVLVPDHDLGFKNLVHLSVDPRTNLPTISGFCGDVFKEAFNALNYGVGIDFIPFRFEDVGSYNDLMGKLHFQDFDAIVGDITITANRSHYVDFTLPFTDLGIGTLAGKSKRNMWIFLDPLSADLWITSAIFFIVLGLVIWIIEHRTNEDFQGSAGQQIGTTLWFAFSTLVYAHRQKLQSNLSRFIVTVWVFVVLVLTSSYTATLSSLLTVQQIASREGSIGFQALSSVSGVVLNMVSAANTLEPLYSPEAYAEALRSGRVGIIIDEIMYIKTVLAMYPDDDFSLIATTATTNGFGFAFQKGSPLAAEMSTEIAKLREEGTLKVLEDKWLKRQSAVMAKDFAPAPKILDLDGFRGLFLICGVSMALALFISMVYFVREKFHVKSKIHSTPADEHVQDDDDVEQHTTFSVFIHFYLFCIGRLGFYNVTWGSPCPNTKRHSYFCV